jgi:two-component system sensor histidine kinase UhpB
MNLKRAHTDLLWVLATVGGFWLLATQYELSESISIFSRGYEPIQLDEMPWALLVLSLGLAWYSWRRTTDAMIEIQERIRSEIKVQELLTHNSDLAQRLFTAQEDERRALARDLHDEMGQTCTAIRTEAAVLAMGKLSPQDVLLSAQRISSAAQQVSQMTRNMLQRLRPVALDSMGLAEAMQALCSQWQATSGLSCTFVSDSLPMEIEDYVNVTLYRLVQEALTNVARHAHASQVSVHISQLRSGELLLTIKDNGIGMLDTKANHAGFGLLGMRERVASLGGHLQLTSALGQGLTITARLPLGVAS